MSSKNGNTVAVVFIFLCISQLQQDGRLSTDAAAADNWELLLRRQYLEEVYRDRTINKCKSLVESHEAKAACEKLVSENKTYLVGLSKFLDENVQLPTRALFEGSPDNQTKDRAPPPDSINSILISPKRSFGLKGKGSASFRNVSATKPGNVKHRAKHNIFTTKPKTKTNNKYHISNNSNESATTTVWQYIIWTFFGILAIMMRCILQSNKYEENAGDALTLIVAYPARTSQVVGGSVETEVLGGQSQSIIPAVVSTDDPENNIVVTDVNRMNNDVSIDVPPSYENLFPKGEEPPSYQKVLKENEGCEIGMPTT